VTSTRFPIRFESWYALLSTAVFLRPSDAYVDVSDHDVYVRMGWAFSARFPRSCVTGTERLATTPLSRGVHGLLGKWLVNGSGDNILGIDLEPTQRARVVGFPVRLRQLLVSVDDPDALAKRLHDHRGDARLN
jgi:hypothetical protein